MDRRMEGFLCGATAGIVALALAGGLVSLPRSAQAQEIQVSGGGAGEVNVYVAEEGDTLWDIAERFFGDPWYWPVLWSFNPHVTNPNWIFPGDQVYLVPPTTGPVATPQRGGLSVTESRYQIGSHIEEVLGRNVGYLSDEDVKGAGSIENSREEKVLLSQHDEAYVRFTTARRIKVGDLFLIMRDEGEVEHPQTGKDLGHVVRYLGIAKVTSTEKELNKAYVTEAFQEIERGDLVAPFAPVLRRVPPVRNGQALQGTIVHSMNEVDYHGEYYYVIIDRGETDGVVVGNRFLVREKGDGVPEFNPKPSKREDFPLETVGEVLVIQTHEKTCLGILSYSFREIAVGAPAEMIAGY